MGRPALITGAGFSIGIIVAHFTKVSINLVILLLLGSAILYLALGIKQIKCLNILMFGIIIITGTLWYRIRTSLFPNNHIKNYIGLKKVKVISQIIRTPEIRTNRTILESQAKSILINGTLIPVVGKLRIILYNNTGQFEYGDIIETYGTLWSPKFTKNPRPFDYRAWLERRNVYAQIGIRDFQNIKVIYKKRGNPIISKIILIKKYIHKTIDKYLGWIQAPFLKAIVLREREALPSTIKKQFENIGVIHILAVSGLHVGIITIIIFSILSIFRLPLICKQIITSILLIIYTYITNLHPPVIRATIMSILGMIALTTEKDTDALNTMSFAGLFILFMSPQSLFDVSFQLSFLAIMGIIYLYPKIYPLLFRKPRIEEKLGVKKILSSIYRNFTRLFTVSLCGQLGITPIIGYYFFKIPIISVIANIFVVPLAGLCIALTFILSIFNLLPLYILTQIIASATWGATTFTLKIVEWFDKFPYGYLWTGKIPIWIIGFYYILGLSVINLWTSRLAKKVFVYGGLVFLNLFIYLKIYSHDRLKITYLSVPGECIFIEFPDYKVLINAGTRNAGTHILAPFLRTKGITKIDLIVATTPKVYGIGGMSYIIDNFKVTKFISPYVVYKSEKWLDLLKLLDQNKIMTKFINTKNINIRLKYGNFSFLFLNNDTDSSGDSVVFISNYGNVGDSFYKSLNSSQFVIIKDFKKELAHTKLFCLEEGAVTITTDGKTLQIEAIKSK